MFYVALFCNQDQTWFEYLFKNYKINASHLSTHMWFYFGIFVKIKYYSTPKPFKLSRVFFLVSVRFLCYYLFFIGVFGFEILFFILLMARQMLRKFRIHTYEYYEVLYSFIFMYSKNKCRSLRYI